MSSNNDEKMNISFDWDNTISMSYMDEESEQPKFIHQGYNQEFVDKMLNYIKEGHDVWIVTSRVRDLEDEFPQERITYHLRTLGIINYFPPERIIYTNRELKAPTLLYLDIDLHHDDDVEEIIACKEAGIPCIRALEVHVDSKEVAKGIISDSLGKILLLKRTDGERKWDLPGGHVKEIEIERGYQGIIDGYEREVAEETGLLVPNEQEIYRFDNYWNDKHTLIITFFTHFPTEQPPVDLKIQEKIENSEAVWVTKENLPAYLGHCTEVCQKAVEYWLKMDDYLLTEAAYLATQNKKWSKMKRRLVGMGKNKHTGGGKGYERPSFKKSKTAPSDFAVLEEEKEEKKSLKVKINKKKSLKSMLDGVFSKHGIGIEDLYSNDWDTKVEKHYTRLWSFICDQKTLMLEPIHLNIKEKQLFYSKSDKKHLFLGPTWQMYLISPKKDENGCVMVYCPYTFAQGQVFLVPKDLIVKIGYN